MQDIRPAAVAGVFYSDAPRQLTADVRAYLAVQTALAGGVAWPKALIVPHAGYVYSGPVAGTAYARLAAGTQRDPPRRAAGPRAPGPGPRPRVARATAFATPLGSVPVDRKAVALARSLPQVVESAAAHALEHSLEVQIPFLQSVLDEFTIVPFAVGDASPEEVAAVIELLWGGRETLFVVSSDLSHYHPYREAREIDRRTADAVLALADTLNHEQACGATPINGFALCARRHALSPELLDLRNSGDTCGDKSRVVGYAAFAFSEGAAHA